MIEYVEGDILNSPAQVIVNTVNTVGVMGKGLALSFKNKYPEMFKSYQKACEKKLLKTGKLMLYYSPDHWILLFPTKEHWRYPSKLEYIESGLIKFVQTYAEKNITSIAFPKLGCGNGELNWDDVHLLMLKYLKNLPITIYIYTGTGPEPLPEHKVQKETMDWLREDAKDMSFNGLVDDISHPNSLLPLEFNYKNRKAQFHYDNKLIFKYNDNEIIIKKDELFEIWDSIRNTPIFKSESNDNKELIYSLLFHLGYLSKININENDAMIPGYQLNQGLGRMYGMEV